MRLRRELARSREAELAHVRALPVALVASPRLAEGVVRSRDVEDVVHDLEQHSQLRGEFAVGDCGRSLLSGEQEYARDRRADQAPGLELVEAAQAVRAGRSGLRDVDVLAADHPLDAGGGRELARRREDVV